jgi:hypothetical protein
MASRHAWLILLLGSAGCVSVQPLRDPARFIAESRPAVVYATHRDGALLTIDTPRMSGDSLIGIWRPIAQPLSLPLSQLKRVDAVQQDRTRTTVLITGATLAATAVVFLLTRTTAANLRPCNAEGAQQFQGCDTTRPPDGDG